jgi:hypothetical protein
MSPRPTTKPDRLAPALVRLIEAAEHHGQDAQDRDIKGAAQALRELGSAALWILPIHGVFVPNDADVSVAIERVANRHLGLDSARKAFRTAIADVEPFVQRDAIETAHGQVRTAAEEAYFYAGLALGVTMMTSR